MIKEFGCIGHLGHAGGGSNDLLDVDRSADNHLLALEEMISFYYVYRKDGSTCPVCHKDRA